MKLILNYIVLIAICTAFASCTKDNYKEPTSKLTGRLVYKGEAIEVEQYRVPYELYQFGFGKVGGINSSFAQDGSYSALLFDGDYKLTITNTQVPFKWKQTSAGTPDSIAITMRGSQTLDLDVIPFYMIRTPQFTAAGGKVKVNFKIEKIVVDGTAKNIDEARLFINRSQFVSGGDFNIAQAGLGGGSIADPNNVTLTVDIPTMSPTQNYVFARVGLKMVGVENWIFSPIQKLTF
ncbi:MAG: DUF3823 domain-containing protein [Ferruginibacter sp.]|nr:DUF3823 domain-containing protein [Ferruginibacter sp.]